MQQPPHDADGIMIGVTELGVLLGIADTINRQRGVLERELKNRGWKRNPLPVFCVNGAAALDPYAAAWAEHPTATMPDEVRGAVAREVAVQLATIRSGRMRLYWAAMRGRMDGLHADERATYARAMMLRQLTMETRYEPRRPAADTLGRDSENAAESGAGDPDTGRGEG